MTDALIERVHDAVSGYCINTGDVVNDKCPDCAKITRAAILAVLEFYSEPGNVTDDMAAEMLIVMDAMRPAKASIAAAMRAARDEVSRG